MLDQLFNHLWQSTLFAAVAALLALALRNNRAQVRYWLWLTASVKFLVPFAFLMTLGSLLQPAKPIAPPPIVTTAVIEFAQPFLDPPTPPARDWKPAAMLIVWLCGLAAIAFLRLRDGLRIRRAVRASTPIGISASVEIRGTPGLLEPGVVGVSRPILLLPEGIADRLTPAQLEAVLAHELCHVRRRDNLFASIHMLVEATFWFHPLIWWIGARLVEERERACDEEVLTHGSEPRVYAEGILNVCKLYVESPLVCVSGVTGSDIKKRIEAIMTNRIVQKLSFAKKTALAIAAMAALAAPIAVGILHAPRLQAQAPSPASPQLTTQSPQLFSQSPKLVAQALAPTPGGRGLGQGLGQGQGQSQGRGASPAATTPPAGVSQDDYNHRLAYVEATYGSKNTPMARTYLSYGPPDSIDNRGPDSQIWRYNYLDDFHSAAELEFARTGAMHINYPQPIVFEGVPADAAVSVLVGALNRELQSKGEPAVTNLTAGLPGQHASMQIYPSKYYRILSLSLDSASFSTGMDVLGQIKMISSTNEETQIANLRDRINFGENTQATGKSLTYHANFALDPGSYICDLVVRDRATGHAYGETINFEIAQ